MKIINVSIAIITDAAHRFLITRRALNISHGGFWEIPGGKIESHETPYEAMLREVHEEVGLNIQAADFLGEVKHSYSEKDVCLHVFKVQQYTGKAVCNDGQLDLRWVSQKELVNFKFPEANYAVMQLI